MADITCRTTAWRIVIILTIIIIIITNFFIIEVLRRINIWKIEPLSIKKEIYYLKNSILHVSTYTATCNADHVVTLLIMRTSRFHYRVHAFQMLLYYRHCVMTSTRGMRSHVRLDLEGEYAILHFFRETVVNVCTTLTPGCL